MLEEKPDAKSARFKSDYQIVWEMDTVDTGPLVANQAWYTDCFGAKNRWAPVCLSVSVCLYLSKICAFINV